MAYKQYISTGLRRRLTIILTTSFDCIVTAVGNHYVEQFLGICTEIYFSVAMDKTEWAMTIIVFLGMLLDTKRQVVAVPIEKRNKVLLLLNAMMKSKSTTVLKLQQLTGLLNNLEPTIFSGRAHTRSFYSRTKGLKQYHHVRVDQDLKEDSEVWMTFLAMNTAVHRPFVDFKKSVTAGEIQLYSDASAAADKGLGCEFNKSWAYAFWGKDFITQCTPEHRVS